MIVVELAGVDPESIEISVEERFLTIAGQRSRSRVAGQVYQQAEIEYGPFGRRLPLGHDIDGATATASYESGLLRITLPIVERPARSQPVEIPVRRGE